MYGSTADSERGVAGHADSGSAARFFYCAKASKRDRAGSKHPTVKPVDLMRWLVRLVTPPGGTCLDPFAGTGTTAQAALDEGMRAVLVEREDEYVADVERRLTNYQPQPLKEKKTTMKAATIYEAFDGTQFPNKEECARYEADHVESRLVGLTAEQVRAAVTYEDPDLAAAIEKIGSLCAAARREAGHLRRKPNSPPTAENPAVAAVKEMDAKQAAE